MCVCVCVCVCNAFLNFNTLCIGHWWVHGKCTLLLLLLQSASSLIQRVRRCAAHWKTWAARRAVSHRQPPPHHHLHPSSSQTAQPPSLQWSMPIASLHSMTTGAATAPAMLSEWPLPKMAASPSKLLTVSTVADGSGLVRDGRYVPWADNFLDSLGYYY